MVYSVSGGHGAADPHHAHQASSPYTPAIAYGAPQDTFEHGSAHGGHGGHAPVHGNFLQRMWQRACNKVSTIFWDAVSLPKVMLVKLWEAFTGNHAGHDHGHEEPFTPASGFLSTDMSDHSMQRPGGPNEYLSERGFLSGDLQDHSGIGQCPYSL